MRPTLNPATFAAPQSDACLQGTQGAFGPDRITRNSYDSAGRLSRVQAGYGTADRIDVALYTYTANGRMASLTDANGNRAEMRYDGHDRQTRWILPSKTSTGSIDPTDYEEYVSDPNGNRTSLRKRDGIILTYAYDALNRMSSKTVPVSSTGAAGYSVHYGYDLRGLQTFARFGSAAGPGVSNAWDNAGRLSSSTTNMDGTNRTFASQYDRNSNRTDLTGDGGYHAEFEHDGLDRLTAYREGDNGPLIAQLAYDNQGRRISLVRGSGPLASAVSYGYDAASRLSSLGHDLAGASSDQVFGFAYNPASQVVTRSGSNAAFAWTGGVSVDRPYAVNGLNQYTVVGQAGQQLTFAYDGNGNLTSDSNMSLTYDGENRLVSASGSKSANLAYDPLGRLWQTSGGSAGITRFVYDGDRLVGEYDGAGTRHRAYVHGSGADEPLVWYQLTGTWSRRYLHADHQGSIVALNGDIGRLRRHSIRLRLALDADRRQRLHRRACNTSPPSSKREPRHGQSQVRSVSLQTRMQPIWVQASTHVLSGIARHAARPSHSPRASPGSGRRGPCAPQLWQAIAKCLA